MECVQPKNRNVVKIAPLYFTPKPTGEDRIHLDGYDLLNPVREGKGAAAEASPYVDHEVTWLERGPCDEGLSDVRS